LSNSLPCAKVGDFGLAKELLTENFRGQEATARDVVNPTWLAPEVIRISNNKNNIYHIY
jgi:hypothetical protein